MSGIGFNPVLRPYGPGNEDYEYDGKVGRDMENTILLCKNCKHFAPNANGGNCYAPQNYPMVPDYVNGGMIRSEHPTRYFLAQLMRKDKHLGCAPEGKWWEKP